MKPESYDSATIVLNLLKEIELIINLSTEFNDKTKRKILIKLIELSQQIHSLINTKMMTDYSSVNIYNNPKKQFSSISEENFFRLFGESIRNIRVKRKLSQEKLAKITTLHRTYIGKIEKGEANITFKAIFLIASALEMSVYELIWVVQYIET